MNRSRALSTAVSLFSLALSAGALAQQEPLPNVANRIGIAQDGDAQFATVIGSNPSPATMIKSAKCSSAFSSNTVTAQISGCVDFIWGDNLAGTVRSTNYAYLTLYTPSDRLPSTLWNGSGFVDSSDFHMTCSGTCNFGTTQTGSTWSWTPPNGWQTPGWLMYYSDQLTPAAEYCYGANAGGFYPATPGNNPPSACASPSYVIVPVNPLLNDVQNAIWCVSVGPFVDYYFGKYPCPAQDEIAPATSSRTYDGVAFDNVDPVNLRQGTYSAGSTNPLYVVGKISTGFTQSYPNAPGSGGNGSSYGDGVVDYLYSFSQAAKNVPTGAMGTVANLAYEDVTDLPDDLQEYFKIAGQATMVLDETGFDRQDTSHLPTSGAGIPSSPCSGASCSYQANPTLYFPANTASAGQSEAPAGPEPVQIRPDSPGAGTICNAASVQNAVNASPTTVSLGVFNSCWASVRLLALSRIAQQQPKPQPLAVISKPVGYSNYFCVVKPNATIPSLDVARINYSLASYLLIKGPYTYLGIEAIHGSQYYADFAQMHMPIGTPTTPMQAYKSSSWTRTFTSNGTTSLIVYVNPSSSGTDAVAVPPTGTWYDAAGDQVSGTINLGPEQALILMPTQLQHAQSCLQYDDNLAMPPT